MSSLPAPPWCGTLFLLAGLTLAAPAAADGVTIAAPSAAPVPLPTAALLKLPAVVLPVTFGTDHGALRATFAGPLLWVVLGAAHVAPGKDVVREIALVIGSDGYSAAVALGEISPAFENKKIILAEQMNGKPLGPSHWRLVVPGDAKGGRSVRDVVAIVIVAPRAP